MQPESLFARYQDLQRYVGWDDAYAERLRSLADVVAPALPDLIADFYEEMQQHAEARRVITGGAAQIERLKLSLAAWLRELFSGNYDADYVWRRWRVGYRHVQIGLDQFYTNAALSRLRTGLLRRLQTALPTAEDFAAASRALNALLDLDLAIIEHAYQTEYVARWQQAERLAAIGQVAGGVAHEVRNPLNVIKTSVYYLLHAAKASPEKVREHLSRIEKQVERANGVVTALSNFARMPLPQRRVISALDLLRAVPELAETPARVRVDIVAPHPPPAVLVDPEQLRIVLSNLVRNACEAMPDGGALHCEIGTDGGAVLISVTDSGAGIAADHLDQILEPFFTTKARGLGLGLALCKAIVERHEGKLLVANAPGGGARLTVKLPAAAVEETRT